MSRSGSIIAFEVFVIILLIPSAPLSGLCGNLGRGPGIRHSLEWWSGIWGKAVSAGHSSKSKGLPVSVTPRPSREQVLEDETKAEYWLKADNSTSHNFVLEVPCSDRNRGPCMWRVEIRTESNTSTCMSTDRISLHKGCVTEREQVIPANLYSTLDVHYSLSKSGNEFERGVR